MGTLKFSKLLPPITLPDRALQHVHIVVARKFREQQAFALNIVTGAAAPAQVWLDARIPLVVTYASRVSTSINERWIAELEASFSAIGLVLTPEPAEA